MRTYYKEYYRGGFKSVDTSGIWYEEDNKWFWCREGEWRGAAHPSKLSGHQKLVKLTKEEAFIEML